MTTVVVDPGRRHFRAGMRVQARVRGSDRFGNRASARRTVTLQGASRPPYSRLERPPPYKQGVIGSSH